MADRLDREALSAFEAGEHHRALDLIDDAELHDPGRDWGAIRAYVRQHMDQSIPAVAAAPTGPDAPAAGAAFPHPRQLAGGQAEPSSAPLAATAPIQRGTRR